MHLTILRSMTMFCMCSIVRICYPITIGMITCIMHLIVQRSSTRFCNHSPVFICYIEIKVMPVNMRM